MGRFFILKYRLLLYKNFVKKDNNMKILLVEDDKTIASGLEYSLSAEGYNVTVAYFAEQAKKYITGEKYDMVLLDITLPDGDGYGLCKLVKKIDDTPVIFLTACDDEVNVVMGLDMGADDYITKPFRIRELISRIKSVLRRCGKSGNEQTSICIGNIKIVTKDAKVYKNDKEIIMTALEYKLLLTFANNEGRVLSRNQLFQEIWDVSGNFVNDNTLTVYIKRLREKLEDNPQAPSIIQTVRGLGYKIGD